MGLRERWRRQQQVSAVDAQEAYYSRARDALSPELVGVPDLRKGPRPQWKLAAAVVVVAVLAGVVRHHGDVRLATSCTTPAFALSTSSAVNGQQVRYALTGPSDQLFALALDADSYSDAGLLTEPVRPTGCDDQGSFFLKAPAGEHHVSMFRVTGSVGERVASQPVVVR